MENPVKRERKYNKGVLTIYIVLSSLSVLALAAVLAGDIAGFTVLYEKGSASKIITHIFLCLLALILMSAPAVMRRFGLNIPPAPQILFLSFVFLHFVAGEMLRMYDHPVVWGLKTRIFDKLIHVLTGALFFMCGLSLIRLIDKEKDVFRLSPFLAALSAFCLSLTAGCFWEFAEFLRDGISATNLQRWQDGFQTIVTEGKTRFAEFYGQGSGLIDTVGDLLAAAAGALAAAVSAFILLKKKDGRIYKIMITGTRRKH